MPVIHLANFSIGDDQPLALISGPCVIENEKHCLSVAEALKKMADAFPIHFIFKSSYDKANRSSIHSFRGPGVQEGLRILEKVKRELELPVLTDVHTPDEAKAAAEVCDLIQIPAFLCRQTDLLVAAGQTEAMINIKKGQFMSPWDMKSVVEKVASQGNKRILLTDRGCSFGYQNLVSDMRAIPIMGQLGYPVCFDATHSVQLPGGLGDRSGGQREFIPTLAKAAVAAGCDALFIEAHPEPDKALSDSASVMALADLPELLDVVVRLHEVVKSPSYVS